jgi:glycosyltransferase involved in cell wall biosynthesis
MLDPQSTVFIILSFEGPDVYSQAGGLGVRVKEMSRALAERGFPTHVFFIGDPDLPPEESLLDGRLRLHRWSQWLSRFHPAGVYAGEEAKVADVNRSLPPALVRDYIEPAVRAGRSVVVLAEEWQLAHTMELLGDALQFARLRDRCLLVWNANNHFGFERIDWNALQQRASVTTVSRYMKHLMWRLDVNPIVVPNGIPASLVNRVSQAQVRAIREAVNASVLLFKIGRFTPDKRWHQAVAAVARLKEHGMQVRLLMRGGLEPFGGEVLSQAALLGLRVAEIAEPLTNLDSLTDALRAHRESDVCYVTTFMPEDLLPPLYAASTATLANSGHEPFGLVGLEAMASGGVAFVGATGEEYAEPFRNAVVIETDDPAEIAAYVTKLVDQPDDSHRLRIAAQQTAREYTWQRVLDILMRRLEYIAVKQGHVDGTGPSAPVHGRTLDTDA